MLKHRYDSKIATSITQIDSIEELEVSGNLSAATLETEGGISRPAKFILVDLTDREKAEILIHNLDSPEQQEACEILEKMLFGETYDHLSEYDHIEY